MGKKRWCSIFIKVQEVDSALLPAVLHFTSPAWEFGDIEESVQKALKDNVDQTHLAVEVSGAAKKNRLAGRIPAPIHQLLDHDCL